MKFCFYLIVESTYIFSLAHKQSFSSVQSLSRVQLFAIPWTAARRASLSFTNSHSLPKPMSIELVMPCNYLILCCPLLLLPSIFPSIRVFSKSQLFTSGSQNMGVSASTSVLPMNTPGSFVLHCLQEFTQFMSIELVMPSNHLVLCCPLLLLPSIFPSIRVFSNESVLHIRWPKYWSFSFSISPSNDYSGLSSFRMDRLDLLVVQGTLKSLLQHHSSKA